jgi:hypothetical protein
MASLFKYSGSKYAQALHDLDRRLIANFLLPDLIEEFLNLDGKFGLRVEFSPVPHSVCDHVNISLDGNFLGVKRVGTEQQHQAGLGCSFVDLCKDIRAHYRQVPVSSKAMLEVRFDANPAGTLDPGHSCCRGVIQR